MSDRGFVEDDDDPEEGPSDYWQRHSPALAPEDHGQQLESPTWLRTGSAHLETIEADGDDTDAAEYSKRIEQVLATPTKLHSSHGDTDDEGWGDYHPHQGLGYDEAVRAVLQDGDKGEEEFGAFHASPPEMPSGSAPSTPTGSVFGLDRSLVRGSPSGPSRSYLHPSVSRLRSQPTTLRIPSSSSYLSVASAEQQIPRIPSQFSLSRSESFSNASASGPSRPLVPAPNPDTDGMKNQGPAFTFHPLRHLSAHLFNRTKNGSRSSAQPTSSEDGPSTEGASEASYGVPTVMDVNGMVAVGTDGGWVVVYGFGQEVRCAVGNETIAASSGPVTAVTICPDQTFIGVGHANGDIYLYDLAHPSKPARTALALNLRSVLSGRKEGHLQGSRILHIGFVGKRHTSIVTGDEDGRAFWFSLGRIMGVDSTDVVRMLGSYPERERPEQASVAAGNAVAESPRAEGHPSAPSSLRSQPAKRPTTLLATLPLPLGAAPHATDEFHFSALLTPVKLVVVGMKPSAKTWFRKMRDSAGGPYGGYVASAAWLKSGEVASSGDPNANPSDPVLAYSWGTSLRFLRVRIATTPAIKGEPVKTPEFVEGRRWEAPNPIQSLHWFDSDHVLLITPSEIILLNVRSLSPVEITPLQTKLLTSQDFYAGLGVRKGTIDAVPNSFASSVRTYRSKLFLLTKANVQVGTLQHWNDRVLTNVHKGDFLAAINLALAYYEGRAPGNTINLSDDPEERRQVVGTRVRELMRASLDWAFSEERMHDDTHFSADGRGVDLTALFEGLATACIDACLAMNDTTFLFDEAYEHFSNAGIEGIFLTRLESYIFEGRISDVPPSAVQALIRLHDDRGEYALAEAVIWHIEPSSLDINQAVNLCLKHRLWDALIYVYTCAMGDYIAPIVKLISIVCDIQRHRAERPSLVGGEGSGGEDEERLAPDAYKLYAYIANVLSGLWYPSDEAMRDPEATRARNDAYGMLFSDCNVYWPEGSHELVLTEQDDGIYGEPPYPYLRLLLRFDTEAFLHAMDIAFEDPYLNDPSRAINRQSIINLMLDVMDNGFHSRDVTFLHIFVARNLPKYPQFIFIPPSTSHRILVSLAADPDLSTREDRQLAAEYMLSAYTPHDSEEMLVRFEEAGFFRILRSAYRRDRKWGALIQSLLKDPETDSTVFSSLDEIVSAAKASTRIVPFDVTRSVSEALPQLFSHSIRDTARFIDRSVPALHETAISALKDSEHKQLVYLRCLLDPTADEGEGDAGEPLSRGAPQAHLDVGARHQYVKLLAAHESAAVVPFLDLRGPKFFNLPQLAEEFESAGQPEAQLWALDRQGKTSEAFETVTSVLAATGSDLAEGLVKSAEGDVDQALKTLSGVAHMAVRLCREHSTEGAPVEDMWFGVLHAITDLVHQMSALSKPDATSGTIAPLNTTALESLRGLVQDTLQALLSTSSSTTPSFARLFKRLVEAAPSDSKRKNKKGKNKKGDGGAPGARAYSEFRTILSGMLDSFKGDAEVLALSTRLVDADVYDLLEEKVIKTQAGWRSTQTVCSICNKELWASKTEGVKAGEEDKVAVRADGRAVHLRCESAEPVVEEP
ncbi:hypothetical protein Q8F55_007766 [Vanrija albida]|uniref:Vacuolar protein sorting-associated protein 8 central domain-containing protein n=1 Tax=Vanrija albida TaxID=181172 RepID=A0ABR3PVH2_9TREE